jgi:hypothetical protein
MSSLDRGLSSYGVRMLCLHLIVGCSLMVLVKTSAAQVVLLKLEKIL